MPRQVVIELAGTPVGKGRPRFVRATGHAFTPGKTRTYEAALRVAAGERMAGATPIEGPVEVVVTATFPLPQSWGKKKKLDALAGYVRPGRPDCDNILKALDALNEIVFRDDAQIATATVVKRYGLTASLRVMVEELPHTAMPDAADEPREQRA